MIEEGLMKFLCQKTELEDLGNEELLHSCPEFGQSIGKAFNSNNVISFTIELSGHLQEMDLYKASLLTNFIGFVCEEKGDTSAGEGLLRFFALACEKVYELFQNLEQSENQDEDGEYDEEEELEISQIYQKDSDQARAYCGFNVLCVSAMAFLTRDAGLRKMLADLELEEQLRYLTEETPESPYLKSITYVNSMLITCSNQKLLVLQPSRQQGFYATVNDLNNCFHLLFLLEEQIVEKFGAKYGVEKFFADESLVRLAHGEYPQEAWEKSYSTRFMECNYTTADHAAFKNDDSMRMIWGEMPPDYIPAIDGYGVIVLLETTVSRGFDAPFLFVPHIALKPYVRIERELTAKEYAAWMEKLQAKYN